MGCCFSIERHKEEKNIIMQSTRSQQSVIDLQASSISLSNSTRIMVSQRQMELLRESITYNIDLLQIEEQQKERIYRKIDVLLKQYHRQETINSSSEEDKLQELNILQKCFMNCCQIDKLEYLNLQIEKLIKKILNQKKIMTNQDQKLKQTFDQRQYYKQKCNQSSPKRRSQSRCECKQKYQQNQQIYRLKKIINGNKLQ